MSELQKYSNETPKAKRWDVLALGNCAIDDLLYVQHFPELDTKARVLRSRRECGGLAATAIVAAARLGACCAYAGALGEDELSQQVESTLANANVDVSQIVRRQDASPTHSRIVVDERGARTVFYEPKGFSGADEELPLAETIRTTRVLFADRWGIEGTLRAMTIARDAQIPIVGDIERSDFSEFEEWLALVDHLIVPEKFACELTGTTIAAEAARQLWSSTRAVVIVTSGAKGCSVFSGEEEETWHFPAFAVEAVDTTGCGDVFHGAYAAALAEGQTLEERVRFASAAAALKATEEGGQSGIPTRAMLDEFLR